MARGTGADCDASARSRGTEPSWQDEFYGADGLLALDVLRSLPPGGELAWTCHSFSAERPFCTGWVDVYLPKLCEAAGWNWGFTVEQPDFFAQAVVDAALETPVDDLPIATDDPFSFPVPFDAVLELQLDESGKPSALRLRRADGTRISLDAELGRLRASEQWRMDIPFSPEASSFDGRDYPATSFQEQLVDGSFWCTPVWTAAGITAGIAAWAALHAGRDDLQVQFVPELDSPGKQALAEAVVLKEQILAGQVEPVQIGEGVFAAPAAFDWLLAMDPEVAAKLTAAAQQIQRDLPGS